MQQRNTKKNLKERRIDLSGRDGRRNRKGQSPRLPQIPRYTGQIPHSFCSTVVLDRRIEPRRLRFATAELGGRRPCGNPCAGARGFGVKIRARRWSLAGFGSTNSFKITRVRNRNDTAGVGSL